jgi:ComF family protein
VREVFSPVLEIIFPTHCGGCGSQGDILCHACRRSFLPVDIASACPKCGRWIGKAIVCGRCTGEKRGVEQAYFGFHFRGPLREAVHSFKFQGRKDVGRALVALLREEVKPITLAVDIILPLPLTEKRLAERGFNQSYIIAEELSLITGKPVNHRVLVKARETEDQITLSRVDRKKNMKGAFAVRGGEAVKGKTVLLVDDLYTTGSTVGEACRTLLRSGVDKVFLFALARTPE